MKNTGKQFIKVVEESRALNREQKRDLALVSDTLAKEYKEKVTKLLETFDEHSVARYKFLRKKLEESYAKLEQELANDGVEEGKRAELLTKAREQIERFIN